MYFAPRKLFRATIFSALSVCLAEAQVAEAQVAGAQVAGAQVVRAKQPPGSIVVRSDGHVTTLSPADLSNLPHHEYRAAADDANDSATVSGVTLWDILQKAGTPSAQASGRQRAAMYVRLTGADGQTAVIALVEIDPSFSRHAAIVADRRDGKPLDSVEGPWRVIVPDDLRHARWIRSLVTIDVTTLKP